MRAEFSERTRRIVAGRAGYRCSFPECGKLTVGPGAGENDLSDTGTASHIYSASPGGPRGTSGLANEERSSGSNCIWLCAQHARVVDSNRGERFPAALLRSFRDEHELRIAAEHGGRPWYRLETLELGRNPVFSIHEKVHLAKVTLLVGANGTGKSTIFRWIDQLSESSRLWDTPHKEATEAIEYSALIHYPARKVVRVYRDSSSLRFFLDGDETLFSPIPLEVVSHERYGSVSMLEGFLDQSRRDSEGNWEQNLDDVNLLAEYMDINPLVVPSLLPFVGRFVPSPFVNLRIVEGPGVRRIVGDDLSWKQGVSIHQASGSMLSRSVLEMQIAIASLSAKVRPTILLLNLPVLHFDPSNLAKYVDFFLSSSVRFQVVFATPELSLPKRTRELGWSIVELSGRAPNCQAQHVSYK